MLLFQLHQLTHQRVILFVGDGRLCENIVPVVVLQQLFPKMSSPCLNSAIHRLDFSWRTSSRVAWVMTLSRTLLPWPPILSGVSLSVNAMASGRPRDMVNLSRAFQTLRLLGGSMYS